MVAEGARLRLAAKLASREMRSGLQGFRIFLACVILGVGAIAAVGSLSSALQRGIAEEGQPLLGGDIEFSVVHRQLGDPELAFLQGRGTVSSVATMRAMAQGGDASTLVEVKAVDDLYPLYGEVELQGGASLDRALAEEGGRFGTVAEPQLLARLGLEPGDEVRLGEAVLVVRGVIAREPDRVADGFILGPRLLMSQQALVATGLLRPGSLVAWRYRVRVTGGAGPEDIRQFRRAANRAFPDAGWNTRTRDRAAPGVDRFLDRLTFFLTLVGLTSLIVGGLGVANAVTAFLERKRSNIAILKCLGASAALIFRVYLIEVLAVATLGIIVAVALGAAVPFVVEWLFGAALPVPISAGVDWPAIGLAVVFGYLVTLAFTLWPVARARMIAPSALFRMSSLSGQGLPEARFLAAIGICLALTAALALASFDSRYLTMWYIVGLTASFVVLTGLAVTLMGVVQRRMRPKGTILRYAIASLYRPGAATPSIILSLGLGLMLFVTLALLDRNISNELHASLPEKAPSFFFLDVQNSELEQFLAALNAQSGVEAVDTAPMLRGRLVRLNELPIDHVRPDPDVAWVVRRDRGLTYAEELPAGSRLVAGEWWPKDYDGPPLVSFVDEIAEGLGLEIGDTVTVNVVGREITARIANLRSVDFRSLQINFALVFSPDALKAAPHMQLVTVAADAEAELPMLKALTAEFPTVTAIRIKDALEAVDELVEKLIIGVRAASAITFITGIVVLAGALAAGLSGRLYEAAVLKTLGATRAQLVGAFSVEYALLGFLAASFAVLAGTVAAWAIVRFLMDMSWSYSPAVALLTAIGAVIASVAAGLLATWRALDAKPARLLRTE